jgi:hypothetical protein
MHGLINIQIIIPPLRIQNSLSGIDQMFSSFLRQSFKLKIKNIHHFPP